ncbi:MAG: thiazole synthase, partial [Roseovarius sp.]|nr:thiazole synthase [Roseovarius sp.]
MRDFYGVTLQTPMMLGTARYPSPATMEAAFRSSGASVATVSLRREQGAGQAFWDMVRGLGVHLLPNTAGCHSAREAITTAQMAREYFRTDWIKLEVIGHADTLQPDPFGLLEAAEALCADGFRVFPYTTEDQVLAARLVEAGCRVLMPWGAPIGSGMGLNNIHGLRTL